MTGIPAAVAFAMAGLIASASWAWMISALEPWLVRLSLSVGAASQWLHAIH